jgi:hypothetical protein
MAHKKRVKCCRSKPPCADCPVVALQAERKTSRVAKTKRGIGKRAT